MSKIKIINYPFKDLVIGDLADFGEEKNDSLVSMGRAVYVGKEPKRVDKKVVEEARPVEEPPQEQDVQEKESEVEVKEEEQQPKSDEQQKHFLQNEVKNKVEQKKKSSPKKSFWDKLK